MDAGFWHERWATRQIGFHLEHPHPLLVKHATVLGSPGLVLVPLCGKTHDLAWLAAQGHEVVGVELSAVAAREFFEEQNLAMTETAAESYTRFAGDSIEILCGDVFALTPAALGRPITAVYDRAALIALPAEMRRRYTTLLRELLPAGAPMLLITFEHEDKGEVGPPFSVASADVHAYYDRDFDVREIERHDIIQSEPRFRTRGIDALYEVAYALDKNV